MIPIHSRARPAGALGSGSAIALALAATLFALIVAAAPAPAGAQEGVVPLPEAGRGDDSILIDTGGGPGRLELGRLVQEVERTWLATPDPSARARAVPTVAAAIACWFRADFTGVSRGLVTAEAELRRPEGPTAADLWAGSLMAGPTRRVIAPGEPLRISFGRIFPPAEEIADGAGEVTIEVAGVSSTVRSPLPAGCAIDLPAEARGDLAITIRINAGDRTRILPDWVTVTEPWQPRIDALRAAFRASRHSVERETARGIHGRLFALEIGIPPELPFPAAAELARAERLAARAAAGEPAHELAAPGDRWIRLPVEFDGTPCRILVPPQAAEGPCPLVLVAHGMGGSEHMYFEAHGDGLAARLAAERGWILAAPYFGVAMGGPEIGDIVTALERFLPIDRERIHLVGHSLGAMRIAAAAAREPGRYRALAPLSGGGAIPPGTQLAGLPCFVAAGDQDFGKGMMLTLQNALERAGAKVTVKTYAPSEHLLMVVDSLPDVFRFFDECGAAAGAGTGGKDAKGSGGASE